MKTMKKLLAFLLCAAVLCTTTVYASGGTRVYASAVEVRPGEEIVIPVQIEGNVGIMGFRITVRYPEVLSSPEVERGEVLNAGSLNDSITGNTQESFDVVWANTEDVRADGTLFVIRFDVPDETQEGEYDISLSYSQKDTFNERYEDVVLSCENTVVTVRSDAPQKLTFLQRVVAFFKRIMEKIINIFHKQGAQ